MMIATLPSITTSPLQEGETLETPELALRPEAFITGSILDEDGHPAHLCHFTLIRAGSRQGQSGYISDSGDHGVAPDVSFRSPALHPGRYFLRFAGLLQKPSATSSSHPSQ
jgi:hypothetical protein